MLIIVATALTALSSLACGHMMLNYPPAFNSSNNPYTAGPPDPFLYYPTNCCGRNWADTGPCHGYLSLLGTPAGAPVVSWAAGSKQRFSLTGAGNHYGGSCQVGFSTDKGTTFKVATSYEGNCPHRNGGVTPSNQTFHFDVPQDLPTGEAVFAWTFTNREQEFFMNCAAVNITRPTNDASTASAVAVSSSFIKSAIFDVKNAAPSYDMGGCVCTCSSPMEGDADSMFTTAPCHCSCDTKPAFSKTGGLPSKRALEIRQQSPTYSMGDCACTCSSHAAKSISGKYETDGCLCTCKSQPTLSATGSVSRRAFGIRGCFARWLMPFDGLNKRYSALPNEGPNDDKQPSSTSWDQRPSMLFANVVGDCKSPLTTAELAYPDPGPDVVVGDGAYPLQLPSGIC